MSNNRLGKGLDALLPTNIDEFMADSLPSQIKGTGEQVSQLDPSAIKPNPHQPRVGFGQDDLSDLTESIKVHGILQPLVVIEVKPGKYQLVAGERRLRAAKLANLSVVPAIVRSFSEQEQLELAVVENIQRADLKPLEIAVAYTKLIDQFNMTHEQIGQRVGKASSTVSNTIRLLNLPHPAKLALQAGKITEGHARAILSLEEPAHQLQLLELIIKSRLNVREAEEVARKLKSSGSDHQPVKARQIRSEYSALTNNLGKVLGTKVSIRKTAKGGKLMIEYYSDEELNRITNQITGQNS